MEDITNGYLRLRRMSGRADRAGLEQERIAWEEDGNRANREQVTFDGNKCEEAIKSDEALERWPSS